MTAAFLNVAFAFNVILGSFRPPAFAVGGILAAFSSLWSALSPGSSTRLNKKSPFFYICLCKKRDYVCWRWGELNSRPSRLSRCLYRFIEARYLSGDGSGFKGVVSLLRMADCSASRAEPAHSARQVPICDRILHR